MFESALVYLLGGAAIAAFFGLLERLKYLRVFEYLPAIVLIYASSMIAAQSGLWADNDAIGAVYSTAKNNLLPAMLFLMLLKVDLRHFMRLGKTLLIAYAGAVLSLGIAFILIFTLFGFSTQEAGIFAALCGSWMGGTANMLAVGSALEVSESMMGYALVVDSALYTFWVVMLLALVPFAKRFNRWSQATATAVETTAPGCACDIGPKRYWPLLLLSLLVAWIAQAAASQLGTLSGTTWIVLIATVLGLAAAHTPLGKTAGSGEIASTMLYLLVALIGSRASFESFAEVPLYLAAGALILLLHGSVMVGLARLFRLDLFSIGVASLANIGGVASAPILAAAYERSLIGIAVLMAVMGYLIGTFGGLAVGALLLKIAA